MLKKIFISFSFIACIFYWILSVFTPVILPANIPKLYPEGVIQGEFKEVVIIKSTGIETLKPKKETSPDLKVKYAINDKLRVYDNFEVIFELNNTRKTKFTQQENGDDRMTINVSE